MDHQQPKKNLFQIIFQVSTLVALAIIIGQLTYLINSKNEVVKGDPPQKQQRPTLNQNVNMADLKKDSYIRGAKNASVSLVLFNSFTCGYCRKFKKSLDFVLKNNPGKVNLVYHHFNRSSQDMQLSTAAECAGEQGKFWPMFDAIFSDNFQGIEKAALSTGLQMNKYKVCMSAQKHTALIQNHTKKGIDFGITGTPGYIINGKTQVGYRSGPDLDAMIKLAM